MKTYNRSLDLAAGALELMRTGKPVSAAKMFAQAAKHPSVASAVAIIDANNQKAFDAARKSTKASAKAAKPTAAAIQRRLLAELSTDCEDAPIAGDELRVELDSQESMPEVQEGAAEDDLDEDMEDDAEDMAEAKFRRVLSNLSR